MLNIPTKILYNDIIVLNLVRQAMQDTSIRHPEKQHKKDSVWQKKPSWIRVKAPSQQALSTYQETKKIIQKHRLVTVCEEAGCPNISECWQQNHATFMIMGSICTRACAFCNVATGMPKALDEQEPMNIAKAVQEMSLKHVVITSVDRDDLADGGVEHFGKVISAIRQTSPHTTIEILTPDFKHVSDGAKNIAQFSPDVFNHNLETVPRLYPTIRPGARYFSSLRLLQAVKEYNPTLFTKTGIMVGLGEEKSDIIQLMDDARSANVDFLTIGQYLQPTLKHEPVHKFLTPDEFEQLASIARGKGFLMVSASPLTRSSYHAGEDFAKYQESRRNQQKEITFHA